MAARVKPTFIYEQIINKSLPYFIVKDGVNIIGRNDEEPDPHLAVEDLRELIEAVNGDTVVIQLSNKNGKEKSTTGRTKQDFTYYVSLKDTPIQGHRAEPTGTTFDLMGQNFDLRLQIFQLETRIKQLEEDLETGTKDDKGVMGIMEPYLPQLIGLITNTPAQPTARAASPALAGIEAPQPQAAPAAEAPGYVEREKMRSLLKRWAASEKNLMQVIEAIVKIAENEPGKYQMYVRMLV